MALEGRPAWAPKIWTARLMVLKESLKPGPESSQAPQPHHLLFCLSQDSLSSFELALVREVRPGDGTESLLEFKERR